jgi:hypothetical protein
MFPLKTPVAPTAADAVTAVSVSGHYTPASPAPTPKGKARDPFISLRVQGYNAAGAPTALPAATQAALAATSTADSAAFLATVSQPGETLQQLLDRATAALLASKGLA